MSKAMTVCVLTVVFTAAAEATAQDSRAAVESITRRFLDSRKKVAGGCVKCQASGRINEQYVDRGGIGTRVVGCPNCDGVGVRLEPTMIAKVREFFRKPSTYPAHVWPGDTGYGQKEYRRFPPGSAVRLGQAFAAGWIVDSTSIDKVGPPDLIDGVPHVEVKVRGDAPPRSIHFLKFDDGWKIVPECELAGEAAAVRRTREAAPRRAGRSGGDNGRGGEGDDRGETPDAGTEQPRSEGPASRCRARGRAGAWKSEGDALSVDARTERAHLYFLDPHSDFVLTFRLKLEDPVDAAPDGRYEFRTLLHLDPNGEATDVVVDQRSGSRRIFAEERPYPQGERAAIRGARATFNVAPGREYDVRIVARGAKTKVLLDGTLYLEFEAGRFARGAIGFSAHGVRATVSNLRVADLAGATIAAGVQL